MITRTLLPALAVVTKSYAQRDILSYVDNLIGTNNEGNVFAGATRPHGMVKAAGDVNGQNTGGFSTDDTPIIGFSSLHDMGTGGNPSLGNFPLFPELCPGDDINNCVYTRTGRMISYGNESIIAEPGRFAVSLVNGISSEMAVGERAALFRFTFPNTAVLNGTTYSNETLGPAAEAGGQNVAPLVMLDLDDLWSSRQNASISVNPTSGRMIGNGTFLPSFGAGSYMVHFCADFASSTPMRDNGMHVNNRAGTEPKDLFVTRGINAFYIQAGGWVRFEPDSSSNETVVDARMGISFISAEQACQNAETNIPTSTSDGTAWDMESLVADTQDEWREKLSPISIKPGSGVEPSLLTSFYSGMYRTMVNPQNYTMENPLWQSSEPYFDSFYCIWDEFRAVFPFLTIVEPQTMSSLVRSLIDTQQHVGWLPDCRMSLCKGWTQGGSNADVVLHDAYAKNLTADIDWAAALTAVIKDAEIEPLDWSNEGRGGLQSWHNLGYIPIEDYDYLGFGVIAHSVSRTLEYAYNDYNVGMLGKSLGLQNYTTYLSRSANWQNLYLPTQNSSLNVSGTIEDTSFTGFFQPRYSNGTFAFQDPVQCAGILGQWCSLTSNPSDTFESTIWEYIFFVPHMMSSLIATLGGPDEFIRRLDYAATSGLLEISNEPSFLLPYLYHYAGRPALSARRVHEYIPSKFNVSTTGLPGNDDSGTMSAWLCLSMLGLFPNAGQNVYFITPPFFENINITNEITGKTARISVVNGTFDATYANVSIQRVWVDGREYNRNWVGHEFFLEGMSMEIEVGSEESEWGTRVEDLPPSLEGVGM
ncbi:hypothetical protein OHC33_004103 [Knufia fluminis]|uniref:Glycoside hydrolase family 92 protein n=1 Tax=Knufia fluminis TaxID=191047 RepID=A0AAN8I8C2_9EURO|nr:hypothetical protein OHC33_004103 [Knufia fluminis]